MVWITNNDNYKQITFSKGVRVLGSRYIQNFLNLQLIYKVDYASKEYAMLYVVGL